MYFSAYAYFLFFPSRGSLAGFQSLKPEDKKTLWLKRHGVGGVKKIPLPPFRWGQSEICTWPNFTFACSSSWVLPAPHLTLEVSAPSQACLVPWSQHCHVQSDCFTSLAHTLLPFMPWNNLLVLRYCVDYRLYLFQASIRTAALWSCLFRVPEDYEENVLFPWEMTQPFSPFTLTDFFFPDVVHCMNCKIWNWEKLCFNVL